jgi:ribosome-associated toxin RatA of RatAB toxin-antitoxin module
MLSRSTGGRVVWAAILGLLATWDVGAEEQAVPDLVGDEKLWTELQGGEVVLLSAGKEGEDSSVVVAIIIDAPVKAVWDVLGDEEAAPEWVDDVVAAKIIEEGPDYEMVEQSTKVTMLLPTFTYVMKCWNTPFTEMKFERQSGDFKHLEGYWKFVPLEDGEKTLLVHGLNIDPGMLVPQAIIRSGMKSNLPKMMKALRERVYTFSGR